MSLMAVLAGLLVVVACLYARVRAAEDAEPASSVSTDAPSVPEALSLPAETPEATPFVPMPVHLDVSASVETLDIVVCDNDGFAVPGYSFPLEIIYEDGSSHSVMTDVNGRYYAEYILPGRYEIRMEATEGFAVSESVICEVEERLDYIPIENIGSFVEITEVSSLPPEEVQSASSGTEYPAQVEEISTPQQTDVFYLYRYSVGENGYLLLTDGTESDVLPVEVNGVLSYGMRKTEQFFDLNGNPVSLSDLPADAVEWTDYYREDVSEKVTLIPFPGTVTGGFAITVEESPDRPGNATALRTGWVEENGRLYYYNSAGQPVSGLKNIDGKLYFFDGTGAKARALGIDVSYFNSAIDWNAVKAAGIDFAIIRVAGRTWEKGILFEDGDSYRQGKNGGFYLQGAKAAGLQVGVYVYSNAINTNEAVEEASLALEIVRKSGIELDMPIYFDYEFSGAYPRGRADKLSFAQRAEIVEAFCSTVENAGYRAGVYSNEDFFHRALRLEDVADYELWYAVYTNGYTLPEFRGFDIWQFSESVRVNGMPDYTDMNVIF